MWFCTEDGLNRYDGFSFAVYRHEPGLMNGLSNDNVLSLHEDQSGVLWIGTLGGGLDRFDRETGQWRNYKNEPEAQDSHFKNWIVSIHEDREGLLWIGTYGGGLYQFDRRTEQFTQVYDTIHPWIQTLHEDQSATLWIGTDGGGLYRIDSSTAGLTHYRHDPEDPGSLSGDRVLSVYEDRSGTLWIGTLLDGLNRLDRDTESFVRYPSDPSEPGSLSYHIVASILEDRSGGLWIGTGGGGLNRLDRSSGRFARYLDDPKNPRSLSSNTVLSMYEDQTGMLWFGTMGGGISRLDPAPEPFSHFRNDPNDANSLSNNVVRAIWQDQTGTIWIGTDGGLDRFDRDSGQWRHHQELLSHPHGLRGSGIRAVYEDQSGVLWVGVFGEGLNRLDRHSEGSERFLENDNVVSIYEDREGLLWVATQGQGLYQLEPRTEIFRHFTQLDGLNSDFVRTITQDLTGVLWIGTDAGLDRYDPETGQWSHYRHDPAEPSSLGRGAVTSVHSDQSGILWIGTTGGGLNRFDPVTQTFVHYTRQNGLANDEVYGMLEEATSVSGGEGGLWLSTNNGLSRFDPQTGTFANYGEGSGLQINKFLGGAAHRSTGGEMFFGGVNGFVAFNPEYVKDNPHIPPVVLTSLTQNGNEVAAGRPVEALTEVRLEWPNNSFEFEFAALNYRQSDRNQHAYRLEGFDEDWIHIGTQRSGRYTNLPGGRYILKLAGSNNDGVWNEEGTAITINVVPPFWQRWWFWGIVGLVAVVGGIGGYFSRVRSIEARSRQLERQVEERTEELANANLLLEQEIAERRRTEEALAQKAAEAAVVAERGRLARELHDAVTQTLFSASLIAETLPRSWDRDQERGQRLLKELRQLSRGALAEMRALLLELRPVALVEAELGDLLRQLAEAATGQSGISVEVMVEGDCALPPDVHVALYRIAQEALNNVVKHARAGQVTVHLRCYPFDSEDERLRKSVLLIVQDDGRGFVPDQVPPDHLGLGIMQERAQAVGAVLEIESKPGHGTEVKVIWEEGTGEHESIKFGFTTIDSSPGR